MIKTACSHKDNWWRSCLAGTFVRLRSLDIQQVALAGRAEGKSTRSSVVILFHAPGKSEGSNLELPCSPLCGCSNAQGKFELCKQGASAACSPKACTLFGVTGGTPSQQFLTLVASLLPIESSTHGLLAVALAVTGTLTAPPGWHASLLMLLTSSHP